MSAAYKLSSSAQADFSAVDRRFASLKQQMLTTEFRALSHSALERHLHREGMELMREMLQALLTLKGQAVPVGPVIGADGVERTHMRKGTTRRLESVFGEVVVERASHSSRGLSALRPVDAALNVPNDRYSLEVRRRVGLAAAQASFDKALASLQLTTAAGVPKRQAEQLAVRAAKDFDGFYATRCAAPLTAQPGPFLILSVDQKGVVMHPEDLRLATKKLAAKARSAKHESRYSRGEPHGRKRMATVAAVYTIEPYARTAPDVIHALCRLKEAPSQRPRPQRKRVWASITKAPIDVIEAAFAEAKYRDPYHQKQWFVLIDGNPDLERWVKEVARRRGFPTPSCSTSSTRSNGCGARSMLSTSKGRQKQKNGYSHAWSASFAAMPRWSRPASLAAPPDAVCQPRSARWSTNAPTTSTRTNTRCSTRSASFKEYLSVPVSSRALVVISSAIDST